jgi:protein TonB
MMLESKHGNSWANDRFMLFLAIATAVHLAVLFGIHFGISLKPVPRLADTLDVVLVQWRSETEPEEADYLAQAAQQGGGEQPEKTRPSEPVSGKLPTPDDGADPQQAVAQLPTPSPQTRQVLAVESRTEEALQPTAVPEPDTEQPTAAQLMQQSMNMASLRPETNQRREWQSSLPRREFISANTREYEFASYMRAWVSKVERIGNLNYPSELRQKKLHGDLILTVGVRRNGTVESIDVKRSSGIPEIDQAAIRIVQLAAPYSPLPDNISDRVDILHITRTWRFETRFGMD